MTVGTSSLCNHISHLKIMSKFGQQSFILTIEHLQGLLQRAEGPTEERDQSHRVRIGAWQHLPIITKRSVVEKIHHRMSMRAVNLNLNRLMPRRKSLHIFLPKSQLLWILRSLHFKYRCMKKYKRSTRDRRIESNSKRRARKQDSTQTTNQREVSHLQSLEGRLRGSLLVKKIQRRLLPHVGQRSLNKITTKMTFSQMQTKEVLLVVTSISISEEARSLRLNPKRITQLQKRQSLLLLVRQLIFSTC